MFERKKETVEATSSSRSTVGMLNVLMSFVTTPTQTASITHTKTKSTSGLSQSRRTLCRTKWEINCTSHIRSKTTAGSKNRVIRSPMGYHEKPLQITCKTHGTRQMTW